MLIGSRFAARCGLVLLYAGALAGCGAGSEDAPASRMTSLAGVPRLSWFSTFWLTTLVPPTMKTVAMLG